MTRRVRCCATKELGNASEFIKIDGKYYKNKEIYEKCKNEKDITINIFKKNFRNIRI